MHAARIDTQSRPARIYRYLKKRRGRWIDAWRLNQETIYSICLATQIAAINQRLRMAGGHERVEYRPISDPPLPPRGEYRLVRVRKPTGTAGE